MKRKIQKSIAFCLTSAVLAAICAGCGTAKTESTQPTQATVPPTTAETVMTEPTETPAQKAMMQYAEFLEAYPAADKDTETLDDLTFGYEDDLAEFGKHYDYFTILDLDQDSIPELIAFTVINNKWVPVSAFQYQESANDPKLLKDPLAPDSHATFECMSTAGGAYNVYICKENHLHCNWGGDTPIGFQEENHAYVLSQDGLTAVDCALSSHTGDASDVAVNIWDVMETNNAEMRNSVLAP